MFAPQIIFSASQEGTQFYLESSESSEVDDLTELGDRRVGDSVLPGNQSAARFLLQASLGPTMDMINAEQAAFETDADAAAKSWMQAQIAMPATLHRAYFRERLNPRLIGDAVSEGSAYLPCSVGSRWHNWSFTQGDIGKSMVFSGDGMGNARRRRRASLTVDDHPVTITVDDVRRTEVRRMDVVQELTVTDCTASSQDSSEPCTQAYSSQASSPWGMDLIDGSYIGQWIQLEFSGIFTVNRFSWVNRMFRDVKDVTLEFSDGYPSQSATLQRNGRAYPGGCSSSSFADPSSVQATICASGKSKSTSCSCAQALTPVDTSFVKITIDSVYMPGGIDSSGMGAEEIRFWGADVETINTLTESGSIKICSVTEVDGGFMTVGQATEIDGTMSCPGYMVNPQIMFSNPEGNNIQEFDSDQAEFVDLAEVPGVRTLSSISMSCDGTKLDMFTRMASDPQGLYYKHDPALELLENTLESPATVPVYSTRDTGCPTVPKTFLNKDHCVQRPSCAPLSFSPTATVLLDDDNLRQWYLLSGRYVYYITGLQLWSKTSALPCQRNAVSRWKVYPGSCNSASLSENANSATKTTVENALAASTDTNPVVRDIMLTGTGIDSDSSCDNIMEMVVEVGGTCYQHVHPDEYSVLDFSSWTVKHEGNSVALAAGRPNPIKRFAETGSAHLTYPGHHPMERFDLFIRGHYGSTVNLGRYKDNIVFNNLPELVKTAEVGQHFGAGGSQSGASEVCGSPGEVANKPATGRLFRAGLHGEDAYTIFKYHNRGGKKVVWWNAILDSEDALRQRVAWALSQIWTAGSVSCQMGSSGSEHWVSTRCVSAVD